MHNPVSGVVQAEVIDDSELLAVLVELVELRFGLTGLEGFVLIEGRGVVVGRCGGLVGAEDSESAFTESAEGHGRGDFVDIVSIDVEHRASAVELPDHVCIPNFIKECLRHGLS